MARTVSPAPRCMLGTTPMASRRAKPPVDVVLHGVGDRAGTAKIATHANDVAIACSSGGGRAVRTRAP